MKSSTITCVATILAGVGAVNWGLVGLLDFNLVTWIANLVSLPVIETIVYILVGLSGIWVLINKFTTSSD